MFRQNFKGINGFRGGAGWRGGAEYLAGMGWVGPASKEERQLCIYLVIEGEKMLINQFWFQLTFF